MKNRKKTRKEENDDKLSAEESLEQIIDRSKTVADAYRKILHSLELKAKKNQ